MFEHILVATDFSLSSLAAVWSARELALRANGRVTLAHVLAPTASEGIVREALEEVRANILDGMDVELALLKHPRADVAICGHATVVHPDVIVAGRHGEHRLDERLIGTTTERIVRHAPCSTFVVHPVQREALTSLERIAVGYDFSESSLPAIDAAKQLAKLFDAAITLLHVYDVLPPVPVLEDSSSAGADFTTMCNNALEKLRREELHDVRSSKYVARDKSTVTGIVEYADDHQIDLLVLGTHGRTGASRLLLGSVAERTVRHAPCAVLVVKRR